MNNLIFDRFEYCHPALGGDEASERFRMDAGL